MRKYISGIQIYALLLSLICLPCLAQKIPPATVGDNAAPRVKKNYFIKEYPQEFFAVQCGLEDRGGNMWFGTGGNGIYYYDGVTFTNFTHKEGLCHDDILCALEDRTGIIWFGTRNGIIRYIPSGTHPVKRDFSNFLISANTITYTTHTKIPYSYKVADNFVWSIFQDKAGKIWFGTNNGIYIHDPDSLPAIDAPLFTRFLDNEQLVNNSKLHLKDITSIAEDNQGNMWFCSGYTEGEGICCYDRRAITSFKPDGIGSFRTIVKGNRGNLFFLSAFRGVYSYDGKSFTNFTKKIGVTNDTIVSIKEDRAGNLWLGRNSDNMQNGGYGGVWRYNGKSLKLFTTRDGLSHNCVFCILEDSKNNMWFGTRNTGLCRYNGKTFTDFTDK